MTTPDEHPTQEEYPSGLLENPGGPIPLFLKLTYVGFVIFGIVYFVLYVSGDGSPMVELYNQMTSGHAAP